MTPPALLSLLQQGAEIWNRQRPRVRGGPLPSTYWGFYPEDFDEYDHARSLVDLSGANISLTFLMEANLENADLRDADLYWTSLHEANLRGADLRRTHLRETMFNRADLRGADLRGADVSTADLALSQLQEVRSLDLAALKERWRVCTEKDVLFWLRHGEEMVWRQLRQAEQRYEQADLAVLRELIERKALGSWERYRLWRQEHA